MRQKICQGSQVIWGYIENNVHCPATTAATRLLNPQKSERLHFVIHSYFCGRQTRASNRSQLFGDRVHVIGNRWGLSFSEPQGLSSGYSHEFDNSIGVPHGPPDLAPHLLISAGSATLHLSWLRQRLTIASTSRSSGPVLHLL